METNHTLSSHTPPDGFLPPESGKKLFDTNQMLALECLTSKSKNLSLHEFTFVFSKKFDLNGSSIEGPKARLFEDLEAVRWQHHKPYCLHSMA
ncbi:unnamed protein product [Protopolystoma xenopodis]|uniref:Uncharacterized protein n=1 Tax=Protopolystoma xenopodis TaxID=117903 RepID=A0A448WJP2_9PLAT|nr:unnamed protein product [Protopolystoma xenopodis]